MTRYVNQPIEFKVQVLDSNGDPATTAVVNYKVYDESDTLFDSDLMSHIADGIFTASFTPDVSGEWTAEAYSTNPKFRTSKVYNVEIGGWHLAEPIEITLNPPIMGEWVTVADLMGGIKGVYFQLAQGNDEVISLRFYTRVTVDEVIFNDPYFLVESGETALYFGLRNEKHVDSPPIYTVGRLFHSYNRIFLGFTQLFLEGAEVLSEPLECHDLKVEINLWDSPRTNQWVVATLWYQTKEAPSP